MADRFDAERFLIEVLGAKDVRRNRDELVHPCLLVSHSNDHKEPGASLNSEKLLWNCWKCGAGGTLLWITEEVLQVNSSRARKLIKEYFESGKVSEEKFLMDTESMWQAKPSQNMPRYPLKMIEGWRCYTHYLDDRGISHEVQKEMMTGLYKTNVDKVGDHQVVQPRIVIPHVFGGKLRGWIMRKVDDRQVGPKYKNSGQFPKESTVYNFDAARSSLSVIVVESAMSVLRLKTYGIDNVVATFGAEVNLGQVMRLKTFDEVIAFPDGDRAGYRAMRHEDKRNGAAGFLPLMSKYLSGGNLYVVDHGLGEDGFNDKDPADYTADEVNELLSHKVSARTWSWRNHADQKVHSVGKGLGSEGTWD